MFTRLPVDASDRDRIGESWNDVTIPSLSSLGRAGKLNNFEILQKIEGSTK